jgi:hypothetical protein
MPDYRALCAELLADYDNCHYRSELSDRAHALLVFDKLSISQMIIPPPETGDNGYEALCRQLLRDLAAARDALEAWTEYFTENEQPTAKSFCMKEYKSARDAYSNACTAMAVLRRPAHYALPTPEATND